MLRGYSLYDKIQHLSSHKSSSSSNSDRLTQKLTRNQFIQSIFNLNHSIRIIVIALIFQNLINITETNTQSTANSNSNLLLRKSKFITHLQPTNDNDGIRMVEISGAQRKEETKYKFKVSPTRIRFANARSKTQTQDTSKRDKMLSDQLIGFSHLRSKQTRQMARPAYELWLDMNTGSNLVNPGNSKILDKKVNLDYPSSVEAIEPTSILSNSSHRLNLNNMRNLLPKPVMLMSSNSDNRIVKIRSIHDSQIDEADDPKGRSESNEDEESSDETGNKEANLEQDSALVDEPDINNDLSKSFSKSANHHHINFKTSDSDAAIERAESRRLRASIVYPPGDLDRLYSDALLVYVKDFNQYIKKK